MGRTNRAVNSNFFEFTVSHYINLLPSLFINRSKMLEIRTFAIFCASPLDLSPLENYLDALYPLLPTVPQSNKNVCHILRNNGTNKGDQNIAREYNVSSK
jgi:hypothetical protein